MKPQQSSGLIAYFARNPVAANLLMLFIIVMGIASFFSVQRQTLPNFEVNYVKAQVEYPGASPQEIEESILVKVEESLKDVTGIKQVVSKASRGSGEISLEVDVGQDLNLVVDNVKQRIDSLSGFPAGMEPINVYKVEFQQSVIEMSLVGDRSLLELKPVAKVIEGELLQLQDVALVELSAPEYEISIEVEPSLLKKYNLTLMDVSAAVKRHSENYSAGEVRTGSGMISVRIENQFYRGEEFESIPVKIGFNGSKVLLGDIAKIKDGFTEEERYFRYSGKNAIYLKVKATKEQNVVQVAESVNRYIQEKNKKLPPDLRINTLVDMTFYLKSRLDMMLKNLLQGAILVALMLSIFLRFKLAIWVVVGLPICFLGALMVMPIIGVTINIVSLFAFIMVLGIVVDDAIVIGESVYSEIEKEGSGVENVISGAKRVATPATFGVLTTIAVFAPFTMSTGPERAFFYGIAVIAILCMIFSLIESKLILPAHLAHVSFAPIPPNSWRAKFNDYFLKFVDGPYRRTLEICTHWRWGVFSGFIAVFIISASLVTANYVRMVPSPKVPHDFPNLSLEMSTNASSSQTIEALKQIEEMILTVEADTEISTGKKMVKDMLSLNLSRTEGLVIVPLVDETERPYDTFELSRRWRNAMPDLPGLKRLTIYDDVNDGAGGDEFGFLLYGSDLEALNEAGETLISKLRLKSGLFDISSSINASTQEVLLSLTPLAHDLGLDLNDIATQVGSSYYGGEAERLIRDGEELKVMVRYPKLTREAFSSLRYAVIQTKNGDHVMLGDVVDITEKVGVGSIRREGGYRSVYVYGSIDEQLVEPDEIIADITKNTIPQILNDFPGVKSELGGFLEEQQAQRNEQAMFFLAGMVVVYILLAVPLKSYVQPFIVMSIIPLSMTGAIWGHYWFGLDISIMSTFGLIAAAGVVINDSLVLTHHMNEARTLGASLKDAVINAGRARFRAILLTSLTTFMGVLPIMFETSLQARFMIPMAVALGFAVLFATLLTLILVPCLYLMLEDIRALIQSIKERLVAFLFPKTDQTKNT